MQELWVVRAGQIPYGEGRGVQKRLEQARHAGEIADTMLLLEHPPVYTKGRRSTPDELPMGEDWYAMQGIEVCETDRGGRVTYHGPGQLVGYPIVDLGAYENDVHEYIRHMERAMITSLSAVGVEAGLIEGLTGVWTDGARPGEDPGGREARKIGSIGVHVNRGITTHGFAINVNNDLQPFEWIVPCGIEACRVTSVARERGAEQEMDALMDVVRDRFGEVYEREPVEREISDLGIAPQERDPAAVR
jgi:lipoyl(octanoyl) transferase